LSVKDKMSNSYHRIKLHWTQKHLNLQHFTLKRLMQKSSPQSIASLQLGHFPVI